MLSVLLSPAISLMNRLTYLYKFSLINVLFLLPLMGLAYLQLDEISVEQRITQKELKGMGVLKEALLLTEIASKKRDLIVIQGSDYSLHSEIEQQQTAFSSQLDIVDAAIKDFENSEKLIDVIIRLRQLNGLNAGSGTIDLSSLFVKENQQVLQSWILVHSLSYETGLYQDKDSYNFILMKLVLDSMKPLLEHQGQLRSYSSVVVKARSINSSVMEVLNRLLDDLINDQKRLDNKLRPVIGAEVEFGTELVGKAQNIIDQLKQGTDRFDNDLLMNEQLEHDWEQYFEYESATSKAIYSFIDQALAYVELKLQQRENQQNSYFYSLLLGIGFVFLVTNYLMLAFSFSVRQSIQSILQSADRVAQGDLTCQIEITNRDELGELASRFNQMTERMRELLSQVTVTVQSVVSQAGEVDCIARESSEAVERQRRDTEQVAAAVNQMVSSAQEVADKTVTASQQSNEVDEKAVKGQRLVQATLSDIEQLSKDIDHSMGGIHQLAADSDSITRVLGVIKGIAEQTNLLALNASIEAARAGEQGRGFAVVADEVRNLAQRTQGSAFEIEQMILSLQNGVDNAVKAMEISHQKAGQTVTNSSEVGRMLEHILQATARIVEFNTQIASAGEEQTMVASEIERNVQQISDVGILTAEGAKGTVKACQKMTRQAENLKQVVTTFRV